MAWMAMLVFIPMVQTADAAGPNAFEFVAIGDMPYNLPGDYEKFDRLIDRINLAKPAFTIHVGDIMSGRTPCSDDNIGKIATQFTRFEGALVYTPGDNEWTDCHRTGFDPLERLEKVRQTFFPDMSKSLGKAPIAVVSQAQTMRERFATYVENARFEKNAILFATVHIVGSLNNFDPKRPAMVAEYEARDIANEAWIDATFKHATDSHAKGVVFAWQANVHALRPGQTEFSVAFARTIAAIDRGARAYSKPVLVVFGDYHFFEVSRFWTAPRQSVPNVTTLQVYGEHFVHGVTVSVDPDAPGIFGFAPLIVPENGPH